MTALGQTTVTAGRGGQYSRTCSTAGGEGSTAGRAVQQGPRSIRLFADETLVRLATAGVFLDGQLSWLEPQLAPTPPPLSLSRVLK